MSTKISNSPLDIRDYVNNPLDYGRKFLNDIYEGSVSYNLDKNLVEFEAIIISDNAQIGVVGGTEIRKVNSEDKGELEFISYNIRFINSLDNDKTPLPDAIFPDPFDEKTKEDFVRIRDAIDMRGVHPRESVFGISVNEIPIGRSVTVKRNNDVFFIIEASKRDHPLWQKFLATIPKGPASGQQQFKNNSGQIIPPGAAYPDKTQSPLNKNQATFIRKANRVEENKIELIVLHSTDGSSKPGSAQRTVNRFAGLPTISYTDPITKKKNPPCSDYPEGPPHGTICHPIRNQIEKPVSTSIHYAIEGNGSVVQGVMDQDIAYHAGNYNSKSIGIELCGKPGVGPGQGAGGLYAKMYTDEMLNECAKLVAAKCALYNLKPTRKYVTGHEDLDPGRRSDPGTKFGDNHWNWEDFMSRVKKFYDAEIAEKGNAT